MRIRLYFSLMLGSLLAFSCQHQLKIDKEIFLADANLELGIEEKILVIPQHGCSNCFIKSLKLIQQYHNQPKVRFIFTHYSSKKGVKVRLGVIGIEDTDRIGFIDLDPALNLGLSQMFPALIDVSDKAMWDVAIMNDPEGEDWKELEESLKSY